MAAEVAVAERAVVAVAAWALAAVAARAVDARAVVAGSVAARSVAAGSAARAAVVAHLGDIAAYAKSHDLNSGPHQGLVAAPSTEPVAAEFRFSV